MQPSFQWYTGPIVDTWKGLLTRSIEEKRPFNELGAQVEQFYSGVAGFMFTQNYATRYMTGGGAFKPPKFRVDFKKGFEFIALMWPRLFWDLAYRKVKPYEPPDMDMTAFSGNDPALTQYISQLMDLQAQSNAKSVIRAQVMEQVLNKLPRIQPNGGLTEDASYAVFESLLKGAGFLVTEPYRFPGSDKNLIGSFFVPCDDVFVDANCKRPNWSDAGYIAIRHRTRPDALERMFNLEPGSMRMYCTQSSLGVPEQTTLTPSPGPRISQKTPSDVVEWFEIYSAAGTGNNLSSKQSINMGLDEIVGDYVYLAICPACPWPLNMTAMDVEQAQLMEESEFAAWVKSKLAWPTEFWRHNKWPINKISFYPHNGVSAWPEPPLAAALGELTAANLFISAYTEGVWANKQQLLGIFEGRCKNLEEILASSANPAVLRLNDSLDKSVQDIVQFVNRPNVNTDLPTIISFIFRLIEQRTGLAPLNYGEGGDTNARSAAEYTGRQEAVNIRPEFMRKRVADWMSAVASTEMFAVFSHMGVDDVADDLGPLWTLMWEMLVQTEDPDVILRSADCYVEASQIGRPNHERDAGQLQVLGQTFLPIMAQHLAQTGDVGPYNGYIGALEVAMNMDLSELKIQPPPPADEATPEMQQQQQMEVQRSQAELQKLVAESQKLQAEARMLNTRSQTEVMNAQTKQVAAQKANQSRAQEQIIRLTAAQQSAQNQLAASAQAAALKQSAAEHSAMLREHAAQVKAAALDHQSSLRSADADAAAQTAAVKLEALQQKAQLAAQAQQDRHMQSVSERQQQFQNNMLMDVIGKRLQMARDQAAHNQRMAMDQDKLQQDAQHSNMIADQKLLMLAVQHGNRGE